MSTITLKLVETDSKFLEAVSTCLYDVNGHDFYHMPFWFKKVGDGLYVQYGFDDLPPELISRIRSTRESLSDELIPEIKKQP